MIESHYEDEPKLTESLTVCSTAEEWLSGLRMYPGAMGLTDKADFGTLSIQTPCYYYPKTLVCKDARAKRMLPGS